VTLVSRVVLALACTAASLAVAPAAGAQDVSREELRELARDAVSDPAALEELRRVDAVDGQPVDLERALESAEGEELSRRLASLAGDTAPRPAVDADTAQGEAREIVSERRFRGTEVPRPFRRLVRWLGDRLAPAGAALDRLAGWLPGGRSALWTLLGAAVALAAAIVASRMGRRRAARALEDAGAPAHAKALDPARLEREAREAERRGDLVTALRLLFRAGLLRLDRGRAIVLRDSLTTGEVRRRLRLPEFDALARTFDEVVYGGRPPEAGDVEAFRRSWTSVLERVGAR
jgi:hypothetical protein